MATKIRMRHPKTGIVKDGFFGFSWTYLFFGFFVPLLRGHYAMAGIHFIIYLFNWVSFGILGIILAFFFNKFYTLRLIEDGYEFDDDESLVQTARSILGIVKPN